MRAEETGSARCVEPSRNNSSGPDPPKKKTQRWGRGRPPARAVKLRATALTVGQTGSEINAGSSFAAAPADASERLEKPAWEPSSLPFCRDFKLLERAEKAAKNKERGSAPYLDVPVHLAHAVQVSQTLRGRTQS